MVSAVLARPEGLEPPPCKFEACRSVHLSYGRAPLVYHRTRGSYDKYQDNEIDALMPAIAAEANGIVRPSANQQQPNETPSRRLRSRLDDGSTSLEVTQQSLVPPLEFPKEL